jgi:hypothetical protein
MAHTTGRAGLARGKEAPEDGVAKPFSASFPINSMDPKWLPALRNFRDTGAAPRQ